MAIRLPWRAKEAGGMSLLRFVSDAAEGSSSVGDAQLVLNSPSLRMHEANLKGCSGKARINSY